ncbi:hypothetical protein ABT237_34515 [Streptomyces sp. NPDC001581]|uniref:hypothetical protein n=1 Tax=Streptomyces sp. NPDC001581 TaxID=3154386 RepID=UPI0033220A32
MNGESEIDLSELDATAKGSQSKSQVGPRVVASSVDLLVHFRTLNGSALWVDFKLSPCKTTSLIAVTAFEIKNGLPIKGSAPIHCMNTIAQDGKVSMMVDVLWDTPIRVEFDFMIFN